MDWRNCPTTSTWNSRYSTSRVTALAKVPPWKSSWVKDCCLREEINHGVFSSACFISKPSQSCPRRDSCPETWQNRNCTGLLSRLSGFQLASGHWPKVAYELLKGSGLQDSCCLSWDFAHIPLPAKAHPWNSSLAVVFFNFRHGLFPCSTHRRTHFTFKLNTEDGILAA